MQEQRISRISLAVFTGLFVWGYTKTSPIIINGEFQWLPIILATLSVLFSIRLVTELLIVLAKFFEWLSAHKPTGKSGTAGWAKYKDYKKELIKKDAGPFWGMSIENRKLFIDFSSNAVVIGPSGSGKGHTQVIPLIFLIPHSKIIMDFKPELLAITKKGLEKRGEIVVALDPFGVHKEYTGKTFQVNFLDIITDNLFTSGCLINIFTDAGEFAMQLYPTPANQQGDNKYWDNGTRKIIVFSCISECMMHGFHGTLENVSLLLNDPLALELRLCSIVGENLDGTPDPEGPFLFELSDWANHHHEADVIRFLQSFRARANGLLKQLRESEKQFSSFLEGATQAIDPYGCGELSSAIGQTNIDINALKDDKKTVNLFIVGDASRQNRTEQFFGTTQWFIQTKLKRHPNKHVPVYFINDEINNYSIFGYTDLLSYGRGFSFRTINFLQNLTAYAHKHGKHAVDVLLSESEIKLILPGQSSPETLDKIVKMLGEQSVMQSNLSLGKGHNELGESVSESGRKLMTEEELTRSPYGILFVRGLRPILQKPISYSEIKPLRTLADINPFHPKPFLQKVKVKLNLPKRRKT